MNKDKDYWRKRAIRRDEEAYKDETELLKEIGDMYEEVLKEITDELNHFYMKYADENGLNYLEVKKKLKPIEQKECAKRIQRLQKLYDKYGYNEIKMEIKKLQGRGTITRLQALMDAINVKLIEVTTEYNYELANELEKMYVREYKDVFEEIGVKQVVPKNAVKMALAYEWSGELFSSRIWKNKESLLSFIKQDITKGIIKGTDIRKISKQLMDREKVMKYQAERLVRTESAFIRTKGDIDAYTNSKVVEGVEILTAGDKRTCPTCSSHEGKIIPLKDAIEGDTICPFHPNCRCCVLPIIIE